MVEATESTSRRDYDELDMHFAIAVLCWPKFDPCYVCIGICAGCLVSDVGGCAMCPIATASSDRARSSLKLAGCMPDQCRNSQRHAYGSRKVVV